MEPFKTIVSTINEDLAKVVSFTWTSVQVNLNTVASPHIDAGNQGLSLIVSLGAHTGGNFFCEGAFDDVSPKGCLCAFDGTKLHGHSVYEGERFSLVFFTHSTVEQVSEEMINVLIELDLFPRSSSSSEPPPPASEVGETMSPAVSQPLSRLRCVCFFGNALVRTSEAESPHPLDTYARGPEASPEAA